jgi:riboflavin kinase
VEKIEFDGIVFSGGGEGKKFLDLPWVKKQIKQKLGFTPYPGTLNIRLSEGSRKNRKLLKSAASIEICPAEGYCSGLLIKASIGSCDCAIVVPEVAGYPSGILEIIAPFGLREKLHLNEGNNVRIKVDL